MRAEFGRMDPPRSTLGEVGELVEDDDHASDHAFLYIPDLSAETGWSSHRVPQVKASSRNERRQVGFRR